MKIFKNRAVAWVVLVLAVVGSVCIGLSRKDSFLAKEPVALPEVKYQQWICDEADMLSDDTVAYITERNADWDAKYYAVVAVATADSIQGWTPEEAAKQLGADWKLGKNDMLLLMVRNDDYYVACGDSVLAVLNGEPEGENAPHILGLHVVEQIINAHGGSVQFVNRDPHGAKVMMQLPLAKDENEK